MRRQIGIVILALSALIVVASAHGGGAPAPISIPVDQAAAKIAALGFSVPSQSCLAQPHRAGCPEVHTVVITIGEPGAASTGYGPVTTRSTQSAKHVAYATGNACYSHAATPQVYNTASTVTQNVCLSNVGVTDMELWGNIVRWSSSEGRWVTLNDCYTQRNTGGSQGCTATFDCYHPTVELEYMGEAQGYAVIGGVGYFGVNDSATVWDYCY